jgi:predicted transposase/invertase (TIGR01784 family)
MGEKFCRLDINMVVDKQHVDLEIQVNDEHDYPERTLYYWAREYSSSLLKSNDYINLPRVIIISIVAFKLFDCDDYHSEFQALEVTRHTPLIDKLSLHYFELLKLPEEVNRENRLLLWLKLFAVKTEEGLRQMDILEVPEIKEAIGAYRKITATKEFQVLERMREDAYHNERAALNNARREAEKITNAKWEVVVADKDVALANKDAALANKDAEIARLLAQLEKNK